MSFELLAVAVLAFAHQPTTGLAFIIHQPIVVLVGFNHEPIGRGRDVLFI